MAAAKLDLKVDNGAVFNRPFSIKDSEGTAMPLAGYSAKMQVRASEGATALVTLTDGDGITISDPGVIILKMTAAQTKLLQRNCIYDLFLIDTNQEPIKMLKGNIIVESSVTEIE